MAAGGEHSPQPGRAPAIDHYLVSVPGALPKAADTATQALGHIAQHLPVPTARDPEPTIQIEIAACPRVVVEASVAFDAGTEAAVRTSFTMVEPAALEAIHRWSGDEIQRRRRHAEAGR
ncbi:MAG: hypothetical protein AAGN46_05540 [Acidobacteriota bacterium]